MDTQLIYSITAGIFIGSAAGYLGSLMLSKRMSLVAGPLGHLTLPGIALALLYDFNIALGAFPFVFFGVALIWLFEIRTNLPMEALTAVVFASGVAIAFLFLPIEQAEGALIGDIAKMSGLGTLICAFVASLLIVGVKLIYPKMILINISQDLAHSEGINIKAYNLMYLLCIAVIVALGVQLVGGLLTAALVSIPAASSRNLSKNMSQYAYGSLLIGALSSVLGIILFSYLGMSSGPLIVLVNAAIFIATFIFKLF